MTTHTYVSLYTANAYSAEREMSASACTCCMSGWCYLVMYYVECRSGNGNWTTRGYANSRTANSRTGQLVDWSTRGLDKSRTGQLAVSQMPPKRKTKHAKSPMASATCPVRDLSSPRLVQSATCPVHELSSPRVEH